MVKRKLITAIVVWAVAIGLTFLLFFTIINEPNKVQKVALIFLVVAEVLTLAVFLLLDFVGKKSEKLMLNAGTFGILSFYFISTLIISLVFFITSKRMEWLVALDSIVLGLSIIGLAALSYFSAAAGKQNDKVLEAAAKVKRLEVFFLNLRNNAANRPYQQKLDKVYEAAKYCDCSVYISTDNDIADLADRLEATLLSDGDGKDESINQLTDKILSTYKRRAEEAKAMKAGRF